MPQIMDFFSIPLTHRDVTKFYIKMFRESVEYRRDHNIVRHDFMNLLIQFMERGFVDDSNDDRNTTDMSSNLKKLTMKEATAQSYIFFLAGFETSSTTMTYALYEMAQHQDIQDKVREEIDEVLAKYDNLTYDAVNEMLYLHKVINETMRKYPPLPG
ncbi:PREDICTED: probable cytochrome P450 6a20 [Wasmannia auropunctata]|uniref:probable cytochrome P450 6a20 n=1 Tax=Wasmannia auropunctata TaxID=64793 RepID=UPI0005F064EC|nr:PREDICTED: probable cytochrome P450 6a20 [Wasmannia auropunctata]